MFKIEEADIKKILEVAKESKELIYYFEKEKMQTNGLIINESIKSISIYDRKANTVYYSKNIDVTTLKNLFEDSQVEKASYKVKTDYILLKQEGIGYNNIKYDAEIAGYNLNPTDKNTIDEMAKKYLDIDIEEYMENEFESSSNNNSAQLNLFDTNTNNEEELKKEKYKNSLICYIIAKLQEVTIKKLEEAGARSLFNNIEMPLAQILADMQITECMSMKKN